jgi:hypothetical protein
MDPITGLAVGRIVVGALSFLSPGLAAKMFLLDPTSNPQLGYMARLFGPREVVLGALTLAATGEARRQLVGIGVAVDSADAVNGLISATSGKVSKPAGLLLTAVAAGAVAAGVQELQAG